MSQNTQEAAQAAETRKQRVEDLIKQTEHVGKKYKVGSPNNSPQSTVPGMLEVLDYMLEKYNPPKAV